MKQKTRFKNFGNIGYRFMNGQYTSISPKKLYRLISSPCHVTINLKPKP